VKRIAAIVGIVAVLAAALVINLAILDVIPVEELRKTLLKPLAVVAVSGIAVVLVWALVRVSRGE
jgi:hypothetical protein